MLLSFGISQKAAVLELVTFQCVKRGFALRCLRFDDITDPIIRKEIDKLLPIREFLELFLTNIQNTFIVSKYLTIDNNF